MAMAYKPERNYLARNALTDKCVPISNILAVVISIIYLCVWLLLATPFRPFPGDDGHVASNLMDIVASRTNQFSALTYSTPAYYLIAHSVFKSCNMFVSTVNGCDPGTVILWIAIASNAVILLLLGLIAFRLTRNIYVQFGIHVLYMFAAWPVTYHFMVSYTVTAAAFVMLTLYLIVASNRNSYLRIILAGITTALALWSSSSGLLTAGMLVIAVFFLFWDGNEWRELLTLSRYDLRRFGLFVISFLFCAAFFAYFGLQQYIEHILHNIDTDHYVTAHQRFGFSPKPSFFSYLYILSVYGRIGLLMFVVALFCILVLIVKRVRQKADVRRMQAVAVLAVFVVTHALLIDLLPSTKLARSHFPVYPVSLLVIGVTGFLIYQWMLELIKEKRLLITILWSTALIAMSYEGIRLSAETRYVKMTAAEYINELRGRHKLYVLQDDPHQLQMRTTFDWHFYEIGPHTISERGENIVELVAKSSNKDLMINIITGKDLLALLTKSHQDNVVLLLGPYGYGSGLSMAVHAAVGDFYPTSYIDFNLLNPLTKETKVLPYYMHYPPFQMEEEVNQALYFLGKIPDYRELPMGITLLRF